MKPSLVKRLIVLSILFILSCPTHAVLAHTTSYGYSKWHIHDKDMEWTLVIDDKSILELGQVDTNKDGQLTQDETEAAYLPFIEPYLSQKLIIQVNNEPISYNLISLNIVNGNELQMKFRGASKWAIERVKIDYQLFYEKSNNQHKNIALLDVPSNPQKPMEHIFQSSSPVWEVNIAEPQSVWSSLGHFIRLGAAHILTGYDHILFLLSLLVIRLKFRQMLGIITSFTAAHSITLILAALEIVQINSRWIEIAIALTICYVAIENIVKRQVKNRWVLTFIFGLVHGFGFANVLREIAIPRSGLVASLLGFNLGVEIGQLMILAVCVPLLGLLGKFIMNRRLIIGFSSVVFILGFIWFIERQFDLRILGF